MCTASFAVALKVQNPISRLVPRSGILNSCKVTNLPRVQGRYLYCDFSFCERASFSPTLVISLPSRSESLTSNIAFLLRSLLFSYVEAIRIDTVSPAFTAALFHCGDAVKVRRVLLTTDTVGRDSFFSSPIRTAIFRFFTRAS
ncbi:hypothetical protein D9M71_510250 [compost metagenome]